MNLDDWKDFGKSAVIGLALTGVAVAVVSCMGGCTSLRVEYEHVSHPFAGWPFGSADEEDTLDHVNACLVKRAGHMFSESCLGYRLTDGGFYGPDLTGTIRMGAEFSLQGLRESTHNALGGYRDACGELPGMVGDDC